MFEMRRGKRFKFSWSRMASVSAAVGGLSLLLTPGRAVAQDLAIGHWLMVDLFALGGLALFFILLSALLWLKLRHQRTKSDLLEARLKADKVQLEAKLAEVEVAASAAETRLRWLAGELRFCEDERTTLQSLLDAISVPVWRRNDQLEIVWGNPAYRRIVSAKEGVPVLPEMASSLDPESSRRLAEKAREAAGEESERRNFVVEGDRRSFQVSEIPLAGQPGHLAGCALDITEQEEYRAELARHVEAHAEVLENMATAIAIYGPDKRLIFFNSAYQALWRMDESFLHEKPTIGEVLEMQRELRRLPEQADFQEYKARRRRLFTSVIEKQEELVQLPDETMLRTVITPHPFGGLLFMFEDVTDQLVLERARNTLVAVQRTTLDNLKEGVALFGADGRLKLFNAVFCRMWGLDPERLVDEPHVGLLVEHYFENNQLAPNPHLRERMVANVTERSAHVGRLDTPGGSVVDYGRVPLPDGNTLFLYQDISDSVRIERALRERNEALEAADKMKSEFVANVSYELRTPLNTIIGFAEILQNQFFGPLNERQTQYAKGILDSSNHLLLLINDILDLAVIEAGRMALERAPIDLHTMMASVLTLNRERVRTRNLTLEFNCPADIGWYNGDERRLKQVLFNLLGNSVKFTPPGGVITLAARREGEAVVLSVADTGVGIPEEEQAQVFQKFSKGSTVERQSGAGLGLALVRSFVELHGGHVTVASRSGEGTLIECHLPTTAELEGAAGGGRLQIIEGASPARAAKDMDA